LIDNLLNGGKPVTIQFTSQNAFTSSDPTAQGSPTRPNSGSKAAVSYDPDWSKTIALPTLQKDGSIKDQTVDSAVVLAHELIHATHAQRGTIDRSLVDHTFTENGVTYKENWRFEELRTTGFPGARQGSDPSENSIRGELGYKPRASYLDRSSWTQVSSIPAGGDRTGIVDPAGIKIGAGPNQLTGGVNNAWVPPTSPNQLYID
jgi:hypothetical protein